MLCLCLILLLASCTATKEEYKNPSSAALPGEFLGANDDQTTSDDEEEPSPLPETKEPDSVIWQKLIDRADTYRDLPIFGTYLEETDSFVRQYYEGETLIGTVALSSDGQLAHSFEESDPLSNDGCFEITEACMTTFPAFEILGYVYVTDEDSYHTLYPVGKNGEDSYVQYYWNEPTDFNLVEPFDTIENGRQAFCDYFEERDRIRAEIPVFPWVEVTNNYNYSYHRKFLLEDMWSDEELVGTLKNTDFFYLYDSFLALPLLNENGEEGVYVGYFLFQKNRLIAEFVLKVDEEVYTAEYMNVADYNTETQRFDSLTETAYMEAIKEAQNENALYSSAPAGVKWQNGSFSVEAEEEVFVSK